MRVVFLFSLVGVFAGLVSPAASAVFTGVIPGFLQAPYQGAAGALCFCAALCGMASLRRERG